MRRILRRPLEPWVEPGHAYAALFRDADDSFWLDGFGAAGTSVIGTGRQVAAEPGGQLTDAVREELRRLAIAPDPEPGFALGCVGWLTYEGGAARILGEPPPHDQGRLLLVDRAVEFDPRTRRATLLALGEEWTEELEAWARSVRSRLGVASGSGGPPACGPGGAVERASAPPAVHWRDRDEDYLAAIAECRRAIARGDAYQLCLTTSARVSCEQHPLDVYLRLRSAAPTRYRALVRVGDTALLSASPERFLTVTPGGRVSSSPIKGTRRRGADQGEDERLRDDLRDDPKERAENVMIVDLVRNDLARVCRLGTVEVERLLEVETYATVHQLVSTVSGELAEGTGAIDAVEACFPAGSMTGAPKISAVRILRALEGAPRGVYSGVVGHLGLDGRAELAMVIRSIVLRGSAASVGAGGGITALSDPVAEVAEVKLKAAALLAVLAAEAGAPVAPPDPGNLGDRARTLD